MKGKQQERNFDHLKHICLNEHMTITNLSGSTGETNYREVDNSESNNLHFTDKKQHKSKRITTVIRKEREQTFDMVVHQASACFKTFIVFCEQKCVTKP